MMGMPVFQSRNRGSSLFNTVHLSVVESLLDDRFNLVIEVLLFSTQTVPSQSSDLDIPFQSRNRGSSLFNPTNPYWSFLALSAMFQSRNRGSSLFNTIVRTLSNRKESCFNLVIEVLLFSTINPATHRCRAHDRFNLVIEVLLFSTSVNRPNPDANSFCFNLVIEVLLFSTHAPDFVTLHH